MRYSMGKPVVQVQIAAHFARGATVMAIIALAFACKKSGDNGKTDQAAKPARDGGGSAETPAGGQPIELPWIDDDWHKAVEQASASKKPLVVDMWAPWCHTCIAMQEGVLTDPSLAPMASRFVWLKMDTDKDTAAPVLEKLPVESWPTFYVLSPDGKTVHARHLGAASVDQMRAILEQAEKSHLAAMSEAGDIDPKSLLGLIAKGDRAAAAGELEAADAAYGAALAQAPADWDRAPDVLVKQIQSRYRRGDELACAELGMSQNKRAAIGKTASTTDFAYWASRCAEAFDEPRARLLRGRLIETVREVLESHDSALSIDDKSDAFVLLRTLSDALGDTSNANLYATRQKTLLDRAAQQADTAWERMTYNWPRSEVYMYLGVAEELLGDLEQSEADLPDQYDPPYRLAELLLHLGRLDEAEAAAKRAEKLIYGPRKARVLMVYAKIAEKRGDQNAERAAWQRVIDHYQSLPPGHQKPESIEKAKASLAAVGKQKD